MGPLDLLFQVGLPTVASALLCVGLGSLAAPGRPRLPGSAALWSVFAVTRVAYPLLLFVVLDFEAASDSAFWKRSSAFILEGAVPARDYLWHYGPLLAWVQGGIRAITPGGHWVGVLLPFVLGDALVISCGSRLARKVDGAPDSRWVAWWLVLSPLLWHQLVLRGQDESLMVGFLAAAALAAACARPATCGALLGLGLLLTKLTFLPYAGVLLAVLWPPRRAVLRAGLAFAIVAGPVWLLMPPNSPSQPVAENFGVGISGGDLLGRFAGLPYGVIVGLFAVGTGITALVAAFRGQRMPVARRAVLALAAMQSVVMLLMPACRSPYVAQGVLFTLLVAGSRPTARARVLAVGALVILAWVAVEVWTLWRVFTIPLKPLSLGFHLFVLYACWRDLADAEPPGSPSD